MLGKEKQTDVTQTETTTPQGRGLCRVLVKKAVGNDCFFAECYMEQPSLKTCRCTYCCHMAPFAKWSSRQRILFQVLHSTKTCNFDFLYIYFTIITAVQTIQYVYIASSNISERAQIPQDHRMHVTKLFTKSQVSHNTKSQVSHKQHKDSYQSNTSSTPRQHAISPHRLQGEKNTKSISLSTSTSTLTTTGSAHPCLHGHGQDLLPLCVQMESCSSGQRHFLAHVGNHQ